MPEIFADDVPYALETKACVAFPACGQILSENDYFPEAMLFSSGRFQNRFNALYLLP